MTVLVGDCREVMADMAANSVDTIITDPPYGLEFMGKEWDHGIPGRHFWELALRVAKPGAILMAFGGTRTWHRLACAIEDAGWEIRDTLMWLYGSGFPKSHDISKATGLDEWQGWGTALKPAWEPIILAMKPLDGTFAQNALKWGVAGLNIDGGRVETDEELGRNNHVNPYGSERTWSVSKTPPQNNVGTAPKGRFPANFIHDGSDEVLELFPNVKAGVAVRHNIGHSPSANINYATGSQDINMREDIGYGDSGSAARFFYCAKASRSERNAGLEGMEEKESSVHVPRGKCDKCGKWRNAGEITCSCGGTFNVDKNPTTTNTNHHPTVKPISLLRYLCRLTKTPTGGVVLDPFMGSGSTGCACALEGREFIGIEQEPEYAEIAERRIAYWETLHDPLPRR